MQKISSRRELFNIFRLTQIYVVGMQQQGRSSQHFLTSKSGLRKMLIQFTQDHHVDFRKNGNFRNCWIGAREVTSQLYPQNCLPSAKNIDFTVFEAKTSKISLLCFHFLDNRTLIKETQKCTYLPTTCKVHHNLFSITQ